MPLTLSLYCLLMQYTITKRKKRNGYINFFCKEEMFKEHIQIVQKF